MNNFANIESSGILKNDYDADKPAASDMKEALKRRKDKLIAQGSVSDNPTYSSKDKDDQ